MHTKSIAPVGHCEIDTFDSSACRDSLNYNFPFVVFSFIVGAILVPSTLVLFIQQYVVGGVVQGFLKRRDYKDII